MVDRMTKDDLSCIRTTLARCEGALLAVQDFVPSSAETREILADIRESMRRIDRPAHEPGAAQPCPVPQIDGTSIQDRELSPGIYGIGDVHWHPESGDWRCLANVNGMLAVVQVKVTPQKSEGGQ